MLKFHGIINPEKVVRVAQREAMELLAGRGIDWNFIINTFRYDPPSPVLLGDAVELKKLTKVQMNACLVVLEADEYLHKAHKKQTKAAMLANIEEHYRDSVFLRKKQQRKAASRALENNPVFNEAKSIVIEHKKSGKKITAKILAKELGNRSPSLKTLSNWLTKIKKSI